MVVLDGNPFILRPFLGAFAAGMDVVDVVPDIPGVRQDLANSGRRPRLPVPGGDPGIVHVLHNIEQGLVLLIELCHAVCHLGLLLHDRKGAALFIPGVPIRDAAAVPLPVVCTGQHDGSDALRGHIPFQLGKDQDDFQHGLADSR